MPRTSLWLFLFSAITLVMSLMIGCSKKDSNPVNASAANIQTGASTQLATSTVAASGGQVIVSQPGNALNGMTITVPQNSYATSQTVTINTAPVTSHNLGSLFNPITPMITVTNGGEVAAHVMTMRIPCTIPADRFAMAFLFDQTTGIIEGMPLTEEDSTGLTVMMTNFAHSAMVSTDMSLGKLAGDAAPKSSIVVSSVPLAEINARFDSHFRPGSDDWEFTNYGSMIAPGGHCAGQSITAEWYYMEKHLNGSPELFGRFDNDGNSATPQLWMDDVNGYRFASIVQTELNYNVFDDVYDAVFSGAATGPPLRLQVAYQIALTHEPQLLCIYPKRKGGHAIVAYGVSSDGIMVADPNFPGDQTRIIRFNGNSWLPYNSGSDAAHLGTDYPYIVYASQTSIFDWEKINAHWGEIANHTIGNGIFPDFTLVTLDDNNDYVPLVSGATSSSQRIQCNVQSGAPLHIQSVYDENQTLLNASDPPIISLQQGSHKYGFMISDTGNHWAGFRWVTINNSNHLYDGDGTCNATMIVNGVQRPVLNSTSFENTDIRFFRFLAVRDSNWQVSIEIRAFAGKGHYVLQDSTFGSYETSDIPNLFITTPKHPGYINITQYDATQIAGDYLVPGQYGGYWDSVVTVSGSFQCTRK